MKSVFCLANNDNQAQEIVSKLLAAGFANEDISILSPDQSNIQGARGKDFTYGKENKLEYTPWETTQRSSGEYGAEGRRTGRESTQRYPGEFETEGRSGRESTQRPGLGTEGRTKAPEGGATGATAGGIIGGTLGLLAGIGSLAIPGLGPFIAAGPIIAALSGSAIGGALGLLVGTLVGLGIPEYEAKKYESGLQTGKTLISCRVNNDNENRCKEIMRANGGTDISVSSEIARAR